MFVFVFFFCGCVFLCFFVLLLIFILDMRWCLCCFLGFFVVVGCWGFVSWFLLYFLESRLCVFSIMFCEFCVCN